MIKSINQFFFLDEAEYITLSDIMWFYGGILTMIALAVVVFI
ncbi:hypothetical protein [Rummeliibacillus stabekisii]